MNQPNWLDPADWKWAQDSLPIACADVVPVQLAVDQKTIAKIGLIHRDTPHQGMRWCMVGGRMWRNESMPEAINRQLRETLGPDITFRIDPNAQPDFVAQYFTTDRGFAFHDPRQHALTMAFVVPICGSVTASGEARSFQWFDPEKLPSSDQWGFGQLRVVEHCCQRWLGK